LESYGCSAISQRDNKRQTEEEADRTSEPGNNLEEKDVPKRNADGLEKFKSITTEVFALTLGLGAFSLAIIPRSSMMEVAQAIGAFAISFFYIVLIWIIHSRFFEKYPLHDDIFLVLNFVILFMVAISPFLMQGFSMSPDFADPMSMLYALDIMGIHAILGILHQRYISKNKRRLQREETREVKLDRNITFIISVWFLMSAFIPIQYRFIFWMLLAPIPPLYRILIGPRHVK
jgi:uncharacterized membrane protein